jgi:hypothetical protein
MIAITFKVQSKKGGYVKAVAVPANHSAQFRFGLLDAAIVTAFLLGIGGLICLLALG